MHANGGKLTKVNPYNCMEYIGSAFMMYTAKKLTQKLIINRNDAPNKACTVTRNIE
jgi:hypothetical protein